MTVIFNESKIKSTSNWTNIDRILRERICNIVEYLSVNGKNQAVAVPPTLASWGHSCNFFARPQFQRSYLSKNGMFSEMKCDETQFNKQNYKMVLYMMKTCVDAVWLYKFSFFLSEWHDNSRTKVGGNSDASSPEVQTQHHLGGPGPP